MESVSTATPCSMVTVANAVQNSPCPFSSHSLHLFAESLFWFNHQAAVRATKPFRHCWHVNTHADWLPHILRCLPPFPFPFHPHPPCAMRAMHHAPCPPPPLWSLCTGSFTANCPSYGDDAIDTVTAAGRPPPCSTAVVVTASHIEVQGRTISLKLPTKLVRFAGVGRRRKGGYFTLAWYKGERPTMAVFKSNTNAEAEEIVNAMAKAVGGRKLLLPMPATANGSDSGGTPTGAPSAAAAAGAGGGGGAVDRRSKSIEAAKGAVKHVAAKVKATLHLSSATASGGDVKDKDGALGPAATRTKTPRKSLFRRSATEPAAKPNDGDGGPPTEAPSSAAIALYQTATPPTATYPGARDLPPPGSTASTTATAAVPSASPRKKSWSFAGPPALNASQGCVLTAVHLLKVEMPKFHKALKSPPQMNSRMETTMKKAINGLGGAAAEGTAVLVAVSKGLLTVDANNLSLVRMVEAQSRSIRYIACSQLHPDCFGVVLGSISEQQFAMHIFRCAQGPSESEAAVNLLGRALGVFPPLDLSGRIQSAPTRRASGVEVLAAACSYRGWTELLSANGTTVQAAWAALVKNDDRAAGGAVGMLSPNQVAVAARSAALSGNGAISVEGMTTEQIAELLMQAGGGSAAGGAAGGAAAAAAGGGDQGPTAPALFCGTVSIKGRSSIYITQKQTKASKQSRLAKGGGVGGKAAKSVGGGPGALGALPPPSSSAAGSATAAVPSLRVDAKDVVLCTTMSSACVLVVRTTAANTSGKDAKGRVRKVKATPHVPGIGTCTCLVASCPDAAAAAALAARLQSVVVDTAWAAFETAGAAHAGIGKLHNALYQQQTAQPEGSMVKRLRQQTVPASLVAAVEDLLANFKGLELDCAAENCAAVAALAAYAPHCFADRVTDRLGFTVPSAAVVGYRAFDSSAEVAAQDAELMANWAALEVSFGLVTSPRERRETAVEHFFWRGIPKQQRTATWIKSVEQRRQRQHQLQHSTDPSAVNDSYAAALADVASKVPAPEREQIQKDIPRTFAGTHSRFGRSAVQGSLIAPLSNVLEAHSAAKGRQCYWQGMSFVAGFLLLVFDGDEASAFYTFCALVDLGLEDALGDNGPKVEIDVFDEIVCEKLPELAAHCLELGVPTQAFSTEWFMCAFTVTFPSVTVERLFDVIFLYMLGAPVTETPADANGSSGSNDAEKTAASPGGTSPVRGIDVLHLAGLAFLQMHQRELLQTGDPAEFTAELKRLAQAQFDHDALVVRMRANCTKGSASSSSSKTAVLYDASSEWTHYMSRKRRRVQNEMSLEAKRSERLKQLEQLFEEHSSSDGRRHVIEEEAFVLLCKRLAATAVSEQPPPQFEALARQFFRAAGDGIVASDAAFAAADTAEGSSGASSSSSSAPPLSYTQFLVGCQSFPYLRKVIELAPLDADGSSKLVELKALFDVHTGVPNGGGTLCRSQVYDLVCALSAKAMAKEHAVDSGGGRGGDTEPPPSRAAGATGAMRSGDGGGSSSVSNEGGVGGGGREGGGGHPPPRSRGKTLSWPGKRPSTDQKLLSDAIVDTTGRVLRRGRSSTVVSDHHASSGRRGSLSSDPRLLEANKIFEVAAVRAGSGAGSARAGRAGDGANSDADADEEDAADELAVTWEGLLRSAGHVPVIAAWLGVAAGSAEGRGSSSRSSTSSVGKGSAGSVGSPSPVAAAAAAVASAGGAASTPFAETDAKAVAEAAVPWFLCGDGGQHFSALIVDTAVAAAGSRFRRGRIEYVIDVKTEFADQRAIVRAFDHFKELLDTLVEMRENGELPEADDEMIDRVALPSKPLTSAASQAAIAEHRAALQQLLDTMQCLNSPVARRLCSDFVLLDADQLKASTA